MINQEIVNGKMIVSEFKKQYPKSYKDRYKILFSVLWGFFVFFYLKLRFKKFIKLFKPLSEHLERQIFPDLISKRIAWIEIKPSNLENGENVLIGNSESTSFKFPGTAKMVKFFAERGIKKIIFNCHLESNQILESLLVFLFAYPFFKNNEAETGTFWTWNPKELAAAMLTEAGFHRFCADINFIPDDGVLKVNYTYCELFMAKLTKKYAGFFSSYSDHRAYFALAPRLFILFFLLFSLPIVLMLIGYHIWFWIWIPVITSPPLLAWIAMQTLAAMQYEKEYNGLLLNEYIRQEKVLATFPSVNPNPVYKISSKGEILYLNPAADKLLKQSDLNLKSPSDILPKNYRTIALECLINKKMLDMEISVQGRVFRYLISPFLEDQTVLFAGNDITFLRKIENDLKEINLNLEQQVEQRTVELRAVQDATIQCLAGLAEVRDPETGEHIERTSLYVKALAIGLKGNLDYKDYLVASRIDMMYKSAPLHDIGKVGIPDAILLKPGKLTSDEFEIMKLHTTYGSDALKTAVKKLGFSSYLDIACEIAAFHHEKWDGTGYPNGMKGSHIPLSARLMALADVYDALISKRVYKPAFSHVKAKNIILEGNNTHFDPDIINAFIAVEEQFKQIASQFPDKE